jgi:peroxiredoxin (alkyl hydroperoxide reductase subunit C)
VRSQNKTYSSILLISEEAAAFTAHTTGAILKFIKDSGSEWKILFSHPADFTPGCTSEIMQLASMQQDYNNLNVTLAVINTQIIP